MSDNNPIVNFEVPIDEDYLEGMEGIAYIIRDAQEHIRDAHLYTKEELVEYFSAFTELWATITVAGQMSIESQMLIQGVEPDTQQ